MKYRILLLAVAAAGLVLVGCETPSRYVEPVGTRTLVSLDQINIQDYSAAAETMINSLLASGVVDKAPRPPAIMAISRIVNNTTQQIDTDMLVKKIRVALNQSGKVLTTTVVGLGGLAEDPLAKELQQTNEFDNDNKGPRAKPNFTLSGKIIEQRTQVGDTHQVAYVFQLSMTDSRGLAVWENEKQIVKQGQRGSIGW
jgi:uncharacterized protein (TIGR02722 family)